MAAASQDMFVEPKCGAEGTGDGDERCNIDTPLGEKPRHGCPEAPVKLARTPQLNERPGRNLLAQFVRVECGDTPMGEKPRRDCPEAPMKLARTPQLTEIPGCNLLAQFVRVECGDTDISLPQPPPLTEGRYSHEGDCCGTRQCKSGCWKYWCGDCGRGTNLMFSGCTVCGPSKE